MRIVIKQGWGHLRGRVRCSSVLIPCRSLLGSSKTYAGNGWTLGDIRNHQHGSFHVFTDCCGIHSASIHQRTYPWNSPLAGKQTFELWYRPLQVLYRALVIMAEVAMLSIWHFTESDIKRRAERLRRSLIRLGPFYIKLGQALSTRPDILPSAYCTELSKLQDQIPPFPTAKAVRLIEKELGAPTSKLFAQITDEPVAAASLGQVYKAKLYSGESVAVKVLRPGVLSRLALDAQLLHLVGGQLQRFSKARGDIAAVVNEMVTHMLDETDYVKEAHNTERFASLYGIDYSDQKNGQGKDKWKQRKSKEGLVKVPKIYWDFTTKGVLTMEWIDGIKLTNKEKLEKLNLDTQQLVDQGVFCSLRQLLEDGFFHADPHPGNLVVTKNGVLAYFDFGMMSDFPRHYRIGLIRTLVHFVNRDSEGLAKDFLSLGFIPENTDLEPIVHALRDSFGDEKTKIQLDFQGIMNQLSDVMYEFNFRLPPEFGLVIRALGSLEGTATTLDPDFRVIESAYPFIVGRLLADADPDMRQILQELLIRNNGSIRWHRLERLVVAISQESTAPKETEGAPKGSRSSSFDLRAVASAADDVLTFILSDKGIRVRILLVKDIVKALNLLIRESIFDFYGLKKGSVNAEGHAPERHTDTGEAAKEDTDNVGVQRQRQSGKFEFFSRLKRFAWGGSRRAQVRHKSAASVENETAKPKQGKSSSGDVEPEQGKSSTGDVENLGPRLQAGLQAFLASIQSAPEVWVPLLLKVAANPEAQKLVVSVLCATLESYKEQTSEASFLFWSKKLHDSDK